MESTPDDKAPSGPEIKKIPEKTPESQFVLTINKETTAEFWKTMTLACFLVKK